MGSITAYAARAEQAKNGARAKNGAQAKKAPPKRWRNRWRHTKRVVFESGFGVDPGVHLGPSVFPSREIAEERAAEWLRDCPDVVEMCGVIYLGAVPDSGT